MITNICGGRGGEGRGVIELYINVVNNRMVKESRTPGKNHRHLATKVDNTSHNCQ